jgi:uncharacterized protein
MCCDYCYQSDRSGQVMPVRVAEQALGMSRHAFGPGASLDLLFFGGEPLLAFDRLREIHRRVVDVASSGRFSVRPAVCTNGTLMTTDVWNFLRENDFRVTVSLDGIGPAQDSHRRLNSGEGSFDRLRFLLERPVDELAETRLHLVISPDTFSLLPESLNSLMARGFRHFLFSPDQKACWPPEIRDSLEKTFFAIGEGYDQALDAGVPLVYSFIEEKVRRFLRPAGDKAGICGFGQGEVAVTPAGDVFPCERIIGGGSSSPFFLGNLEEWSPGGFDPLVAGDRLARAAVRFRRCGVPEPCVNCEIEPYCTNYCSCTNFAASGNILMPNETVCLFEKLFVAVAARSAKRAVSHA